MFFVTQPEETIGLHAEKCWLIDILCTECGKRTRWSVADLLARFSPEVTMGAIAARLVCTCGSKTGKLFKYQDLTAAAARDKARFEQSGRVIGVRAANRRPTPGPS